jgi:transposase
MKFVGVDLHKQTITMCVVDAASKLLTRRRFGNRPTEHIIAFLRTLGDFAIVCEATASYEWFVQLVEPLAQQVVLAHPGRLRVIAESTRKSDRLDPVALEHRRPPCNIGTAFPDGLSGRGGQDDSGRPRPRP